MYFIVDSVIGEKKLPMRCHDLSHEAFYCNADGFESNGSDLYMPQTCLHKIKYFKLKKMLHQLFVPSTRRSPNPIQDYPSNGIICIPCRNFKDIINPPHRVFPRDRNLHSKWVNNGLINNYLVIFSGGSGNSKPMPWGSSLIC